tara:strand:- start:8275 stop:10410 length:2136 start_codon:yes stop_codon:yes gene_type:complete
MTNKKQKGTIDQLYGKPKKAKGEDNADDALIARARERARDGASYWKENWELAEDDLKFISGDQWPESVKSERELEQRPCLTNNVLPTFVEQVIGDQLQNKPSIKINSTDVTRVPDRNTGEQTTLKIQSLSSNKEYELAEVLQGIIKNIEYNCDAEDAYDISFQSAVEGAFGYLRVRSDYLADDTFEQDLLIEAIENQFSVTIDPSAKKPDKSDMMWCFIDDQMLKEDFKEKYPNASMEPVSSDSVDEVGSWFSEQTVRVSEYFVREPVTKKVALLSDGRSMYMEDIEDIVDELMEKGITIVRERNVKTFKTIWRKITGRDVLEGPIELKVSTIPVIPVYGKSTTIKKKKIYRSAIRHSKDAQRMANYWDSAATEAVALAPKAPFSGTPEQIEGFEDEWESANTSNLSFLPFNAQTPGDRGPQRQQPAIVPSAEISMSMQSSDKIKSTMGMFDASVGAQGNETSGRAIIARQREGDTGSFRFIDNLSKAIRRVGRLLVELIPTVYDTERVVRLKFPDDTEDFVKLNEQIFDDEKNEWVTISDISIGKYDVVVTTGPAYTTQRMEAADAMMQFAAAVPQAGAVMADLIALNMDWPGADTIAARLKKIVPPNVLTNKEREAMAEDMPEQEEPTPEQQVQMKEAEAKSKQADADIAEAEADMFKAQLETDDAKKALAQIEQLANGGDAMAQNVRELVAETIAEIMAAQQANVTEQ